MNGDGVTFVDPPEPPEASERLRAADLKNKVCLLRPTAFDVWPDKEEDGKVKKGGAYAECDVWVLDRAGIVEESTGVRISWWRAVNQLTNYEGRFVLCMPVEQEDRSVILVRTSKEEWRQVGADAVAKITGGEDAAPVYAEDDEDRPF